MEKNKKFQTTQIETCEDLTILKCMGLRTGHAAQPGFPWLRIQFWPDPLALPQPLQSLCAKWLQSHTNRMRRYAAKRTFEESPQQHLNPGQDHAGPGYDLWESMKISSKIPGISKCHPEKIFRRWPHRFHQGRAPRECRSRWDRPAENPTARKNGFAKWLHHSPENNDRVELIN